MANRWRKTKSLEPGDEVVYGDPRAKAAGGRTPWKEPLSNPCVVESVRGNRARLRRLDGTIVEDAHVKDMAVVPEEATNLERTPLNFEDDEGGPDREDDRRRSPGQMPSETASPPETAGEEKAASLTKCQWANTLHITLVSPDRFAKLDVWLRPFGPKLKWQCINIDQ